MAVDDSGSTKRGDANDQLAELVRSHRRGDLEAALHLLELAESLPGAGLDRALMHVTSELCCRTFGIPPDRSLAVSYSTALARRLTGQVSLEPSEVAAVVDFCCGDIDRLAAIDPDGLRPIASFVLSDLLPADPMPYIEASMARADAISASDDTT